MHKWTTERCKCGTNNESCRTPQGKTHRKALIFPKSLIAIPFSHSELPPDFRHFIATLPTLPNTKTAAGFLPRPEAFDVLVRSIFSAFVSVSQIPRHSFHPNPSSK